MTQIKISGGSRKIRTPFSIQKSHNSCKRVFLWHWKVKQLPWSCFLWSRKFAQLAWSCFPCWRKIAQLQQLAFCACKRSCNSRNRFSVPWRFSVLSKGRKIYVVMPSASSEGRITPAITFSVLYEGHGRFNSRNRDFSSMITLHNSRDRVSVPLEVRPTCAILFSVL